MDMYISYFYETRPKGLLDPKNQSWKILFVFYKSRDSLDQESRRNKVCVLDLVQLEDDLEVQYYF